MEEIHLPEPDESCYKLYYARNNPKAVGNASAMGIELLVDDQGPIEIPKGTDRVLNKDGIYDYYELAKHKVDYDWRSKIGKYAAQHLLHPSLTVGINPDTSVLRCFPQGYQLYTHVKGPPGDERYDNYLMGSRYVFQFRSPAEFLLHFHWLAAGQPMTEDNKPDCPCRYCSGRPHQGPISQIYANYRPQRRITYEDYEMDGDEKKPESDSSTGVALKKTKTKTKTKRPPKTRIDPGPISFKDYTKARLSEPGSSST